MHKILDQFNYLYKAKPSTKANSQFCEYLDNLNYTKNISKDIFIQGINFFTRVANLAPDVRQKYYGSALYGVHYNNDLAKIINKKLNLDIPPNILTFLSPPSWDTINNDFNLYLKSNTNNYSKALDELIHGPTVIECGMFCQLAIWFGLRYMLGNDNFNKFAAKIFKNCEFILTTKLYTDKNPLYSLFYFADNSSDPNSSNISIEHIANHKNYPLKHLAGNYMGDNCIVINTKYTIFDPLLENTNNLDKQDVKLLLLKIFNEPPNAYDQFKLNRFKQLPTDEISPVYNLSFGEIVKQSENLANYTSDKIDDNADPKKITFDFEKFTMIYNK